MNSVRLIGRWPRRSYIGLAPLLQGSVRLTQRSDEAVGVQANGCGRGQVLRNALRLADTGLKSQQVEAHRLHRGHQFRKTRLSRLARRLYVRRQFIALVVRATRHTAGRTEYGIELLDLFTRRVRARLQRAQYRRHVAERLAHRLWQRLK